MGNSPKVENNPEVMIEWKEPISSKESVNYSAERRQSLQARYIYGFVFFLTNLLAWFVRDYGHKVLTELHNVGACGSEGHDCFHAEGVLRIFFLFMFVTTFRACKLHEARNSWHCKWWALKLVFWIIFLIVPFVIPVAFIQIYGEIARIGAGVFLVLQLISVIHFLTWCNDYWMPNSPSTQSCFIGLFLSTICYICSLFSIVLMYILYAPGPSYALNIFFITWTAILIKVMMVVSLHSKVNTGLLSSGIMGVYVVFLCWSAIRSEPPIQRCNPQRQMIEKDDWTTVLSFVIAICAIVMAIFSTGIDSQSFRFCKDEVQSDDDIPYKYGFFHFIFSIGAMYFAMLFISWDLNHPTKKWSIDVGWASTWVKIVNEWFAATIYLWNLISPVIRRDKVMDREEHVQHIDGSS